MDKKISLPYGWFKMKENSDIGYGEMIVLSYLIDVATEDNLTDVSDEKIASDLMIKERTVKKHNQKLRQNNLIDWKIRNRKRIIKINPNEIHLLCEKERKVDNDKLVW